jgi:hypothetical protein
LKPHPSWEKVDGWRMLAYKDGERVRLVSSHGRDHTRRFADLAAAVSKLSARMLVLDGENRTREVLGLVFLRSENFNQLSAALHELLDLATVDYCGHGCLLLLPQRRAEAKTPYGRDHLLDGNLGGVEGHHRLLRPEAYVCPIHALQPFQGLFDRDGSGPSRHSINSQDDGRGRSHPDIHGDQ